MNPNSKNMSNWMDGKGILSRAFNGKPLPPDDVYRFIVDEVDEAIFRAKAEAVKEFAEKLKMYLPVTISNYKSGLQFAKELHEIIDSLAEQEKE